MTAPGAWGRELLDRRLRQPDQRSCGASVLVVAEALGNERYARRLVAGGAPRFAEEVLAMHRRATGPVDAAGRLQLPWSRALGTPPWAVARQLSARTGTRHVTRVVWPWRRHRRWRELTTALAAGAPVPVFLGSGLLPRHVVLALPPQPGGAAEPTGADGTPASVRVYDPAPGRRVRVPAAEFVAGGVAVGWPVPWFVVTPRPRGRRTRA